MDCKKKESIEDTTQSERNFAPIFVNHHLLPDMNFNEHCLKENNISITRNVINLCINTLGPQSRNLKTGFTLSNCLFGSVKLTKNVDLD